MIVGAGAVVTVKVVVAAPVEQETSTGPVTVLAGTVAVIWVPAELVDPVVTRCDENVTEHVDETGKLVPVIVTGVPTGPLVGLIPVTVNVHAPTTVKSNGPETVDPLSPATASLLTVIGPDVPVAGTCACTWVLDRMVTTVAATLLNFTNPASVLTPMRFVPVSVTTVATGPQTGVKLVTVGAGKAVTVKLPPGTGIAPPPEESVTAIGLDAGASGGTTAVMDVVDAVGVPNAETPPNVTDTIGSVNVPLIVTGVPAGPLGGLNPVGAAAPDAGGASTKTSRVTPTTTPAKRDPMFRFELMPTLTFRG